MSMDISTSFSVSPITPFVRTKCFFCSGKNLSSSSRITYAGKFPTM